MNQHVPSPAGQPVSLAVSGMRCASCVGRVERAIAAVPDVVSAAVNLVAERADIHFAPSADRSKALADATAAVESAGFEVPGRRFGLIIEGMHCGSCVGRVERAIGAVPGVHRTAVNLAAERAEVEGAGWLDHSSVEAAVAAAGFSARPFDGGSAAEAGAARKADEYSALRRDLIVAATATLPVVVIEMGGHMLPAFHAALVATCGAFAPKLVAFVLTSLVLFGPGLRFFRYGVPALLRRTPDMNSLVVLGSTAAWAYSSVATFAPTALPEGTANVYFEAAAVIVTLILLGRLLEAAAKGRTGDAIRKLIGLKARTASVRRGDGFAELDIADVRVGDVVQVRPGERIPVDGTVREGRSFVNESMLTGEAEAVAKAEGASVTGGTLNTTGVLTLAAERVGADTVLSQIIRTVERAQAAKLPIQGVVDRVTRYFVPAILAASLVTFAAWMAFGPPPAFGLALVNAVAVLIVACPCAMGLATPVSIMVATGRGAELGLLFRKGEALQMLRDTTIVAFDKTGTLTEGQPRLTDLVLAEGFARADVLGRIAAVESASEHPIATAIVRAAQGEGLVVGEARDVAARAGFGIIGTVGEARIAIGADRAMTEANIDVSPFAAASARLAADAKTPLYAAIDGRLAALIAVADPVRPSARMAVERLRARGLRVAMITGDNARTADAVARQLSIDEVAAEVLPDGKAAAVARLKRGGGGLAFVGDGINDAPALATADVGIAIGSGTDIAVESADVVLISGDLRAVETAIDLSRATIRNVRQNLGWAFGYNIVLIPVAAGALYPIVGITLSPMLAAAAMALSSVFVLTNALRLKRFGTSPAGQVASGRRKIAG